MHADKVLIYLRIMGMTRIGAAVMCLAKCLSPPSSTYSIAAQFCGAHVNVCRWTGSKGVQAAGRATLHMAVAAVDSRPRLDMHTHWHSMDAVRPASTGRTGPERRWQHDNFGQEPAMTAIGAHRVNCIEKDDARWQSWSCVLVCPAS